jgi:transposase
MKDYTGKKIYLGIDVHKNTYSVTALCEGSVVKKATIQANPEGLAAFCKKYFVGSVIESAYEAGFSGFNLHRILVKNGISNKVVHAAGIEVAVGDKVKTDKRDSLKIATQLAAGRLKGIHVPSEEREEKRALTRLRDTIVEHRTTVANQIKALLHQHGLIPANAKKKVSPKWIESLKTLPMRDGIRYALKHLTDMWQQLTAKIKEINGEMVLQAEVDSSLEEVYKSTPGIGPVGARVLSNEIEDMSYFENERQLFSYTGLTPSEHSSGGHVRKGHISRQGKTIIRKILVLAAWKAIQKDQRLRATFERIAAKAGAKKAIVAIARRLVGHIRACFRKKCLYDTTEARNLARKAA